MSRSQFVRNTLSAIQMQLHPDSPALSTSDLTYDDCSSSVRGSEDTEVADFGRDDGSAGDNPIVDICVSLGVDVYSQSNLAGGHETRGRARFRLV